MKKCIYKITNLINNKIYIGQTNNFERRKREHSKQMYGNCSKVLYNAIEKYGWENFSMEMIEDYCENYNEKENYWIKKFNSYVPNGYNIDLALTSSECNIFISEEILNLIIKDLQNTQLTADEIAEKYNISSSQTIRNINKGIIHKKNNIEYPIRKMRNELAKERALLVIQDLKQTDLSFKELSEKYNCSITCISNINTGSRVHFENEEYPIRKNTRQSKVFTSQEIDNIYNDIINTKMKWSELAIKYNCGEKVFQHINNGKLHRKENYNYPLREEQNVKGFEKVDDIIKLLQTTRLSYAKIAEQLNTNPTTVSNINKGKSHKRPNMTYPIR